MAVSFTNNWKNILDKLENTLRTEFKGALPIYTGTKAPAGSTTIASLLYNFKLIYYAKKIIYSIVNCWIICNN